jgi:amidase
VAAGLIPFADGSDLAASVRNPASFCGVVGLRTTPGLVPGDPFDALGVVGPIARTAPDAALLLAGMCGTDPGLPMARPERPGDFLGLRPASLRGLRVAWSFDLGDLPVQPEVLAALAACRQSMQDAGCEVVDAARAGRRGRGLPGAAGGQDGRDGAAAARPPRPGQGHPGLEH